MSLAQLNCRLEVVADINVGSVVFGAAGGFGDRVDSDRYCR